MVEGLLDEAEGAGAGDGFGAAAFTANAGSSTVSGLPVGQPVEVFELGGTVRRLSGVTVNADAASFGTKPFAPGHPDPNGRMSHSTICSAQVSE